MVNNTRSVHPSAPLIIERERRTSALSGCAPDFNLVLAYEKVPVKEMTPPLEADRDPVNCCPDAATPSVGLNVKPVRLTVAVLPAVTGTGVVKEAV